MGATGSMAAMGGMMGLSAISSVATSSAKADLQRSGAAATRAKGIYEKSVADSNAAIAGLESRQTLEAGDIAVGNRSLAGKSDVATERATEGASGLDIGTGSAALTKIGSDFSSHIDQLTIKNNAVRQAWGYSTQATLDTYQGKFAEQGAEVSAKQQEKAADLTLLSGGLEAVSGPLSIYSNYLRYSRYMGGGAGPGGAPFPKTASGTNWYPAEMDA